MRGLLKIRRYFSAEPQLHPYLLEGLKRNRLDSLRPCQQKALAILAGSKNVMLNEMDGSGKTLAYLLPVINRILHTKKQPQMPPKSGAIILALNKELALGIYRQIRQLDFDNILNVNRSGSITHYSAVVEETCRKREEQDEDLILDLMNKNVADSVTWPHTDILISTPYMLYKILSQKEDSKQKVSPEFIVVDDADLILGRREDLNYFKKDFEIIKKLAAKEGTFSFILASPFDHFLQRSAAYLGSPLFESTNYSQTNQVVDKLKIHSLTTAPRQSKQEQAAEKVQSLVSLMRGRLKSRVVIFCSSKSVEQVRTALKSKLDLHTTEYFARLSSEKRMAAVFDFNYGKSKVLITTELGSRGFSFLPPIDCIVSFDPEDSAQDEIVRMCRSNKEGAEYIILTSRSQEEVRQFLNDQTVTAISAA